MEVMGVIDDVLVPEEVYIEIPLPSPDAGMAEGDNRENPPAPRSVATRTGEPKKTLAEHYREAAKALKGLLPPAVVEHASTTAL
jgi:hypothetical protein